MRILHMVRQIEDARALDTAQEQQKAGHEVTLLLMHDAVLSQLQFPGPVLACKNDLLARGGSPKYQPIDYDDIIRIMFEHDRVISW